MRKLRPQLSSGKVTTYIWSFFFADAGIFDDDSEGSGGGYCYEGLSPQREIDIRLVGREISINVKLGIVKYIQI